MAVRVNTRIFVWALLCMWLFVSTLFLGTGMLLLYIYDSTVQAIFGAPLTRLSQTCAIILSGWTLVTFGAAIRTARANRRSVAMMFFLFALIGFAGEMLVMITLARYRENVFGLTLLRDSTVRLVRSYHLSDVARSALDVIHSQFECCGVDEWHREWKDVAPFPPRMDGDTQEPWVPASCCIGILKIDPTCGFAKIRGPQTMAQLVRQEEYGMQTVVPAPWYSRIVNEPCPEKIFGWLEEVPVYTLMVGLSISVSRMMLTIHAVFGYTDSRRKRGKR
ncbi:hypothetical protein CSKR_203013 [Clonorchis sinensis]|uniref:Uncharacterized protein n=2 Tax=Clonorchis sinensis TaxID=79923 RepID=A0A8T1M507_CLOSI|nr:hypothetical protein CSKR_203013 [Clonorchis sinensis]GAA51685.1 hypothetical protein CLF_106621 [Clonorchis sinensis]